MSDEKEERGPDYKVHNDGSVTEYQKGDDRSDYYNYDKNDRYENDKKKRDHGHVVIREDANGRERVAHVRNGHGDSTNFDKDWDDKPSGGCYIATASLQGAIPIEDLEPLKSWRYKTLETNRFGNRLSTYYRETAPFIARKVEHMPRLSKLLRNCIVKPAIQLSQRQPSLVRDTLLTILFLIGLSIAEIVKFTQK